jgi:hypothetical protein
MSEEGSLPNLEYFQNDTGLKSCWECANIRVNDFPMRRCVVYPDHLPYHSVDAELKEEGTTFAETCPSFTKNPTIREDKGWDEETI